MLLPSALSCEGAHSAPTRTRYQASLFASPPLSPPAAITTTSTTITNIYSSCRALQSMLSPPTPLPSPPTIHAEPPSTPFKLRLRQRRQADESNNGNATAPLQRKRISKRTANVPPRGLNKRRRGADEETNRDTDPSASEAESETEELPPAPSTPKRARIAPAHLPLGLERSDFHTLHLQQLQSETPSEEVLESVESDMGEGQGEGEWTTEDDRILVELVLEKLKLSRSEWQDCARSLGKDRGSVGKRWKSLMGAGEVGLKSRQRRGKIHGTWR